MQPLASCVTPDSIALLETSSDESIVGAPVVNYVSGEATATLNYIPSGTTLGDVTLTVTVMDAGFDANFETADDNEVFERQVEVHVDAKPWTNFRTVNGQRQVWDVDDNGETALLDALLAVQDTLEECRICGNVDTRDPCGICADPKRDAKSICVVEDVADLWALDRAKLFSGTFHVLGGRLSALDGVRPEDLAIPGLLARVEAGGVDEVVLRGALAGPCHLSGRYEGEAVLVPFRISGDTTVRCFQTRQPICR